MKKRVKIPLGNSKRILDLAKQVQAKHLADGNVSPLNSLDWSEVNPLVDETVAEHNKAERLRREMREAFQRRDLRMNEVVSFLRNSRDILTGTYDKEMKSLGQWGFDVLDVRSVPEEEEESEVIAKS